MSTLNKALEVSNLPIKTNSTVIFYIENKLSKNASHIAIESFTLMGYNVIIPKFPHSNDNTNKPFATIAIESISNIVSQKQLSGDLYLVAFSLSSNSALPLVAKAIPEIKGVLLIDPKRIEPLKTYSFEPVLDSMLTNYLQKPTWDLKPYFPMTDGIISQDSQKYLKRKDSCSKKSKITPSIRKFIDFSKRKTEVVLLKSISLL
ncbi:hypothetical protein BB561_004556 [Smittium simulii]|uniref:Uncharacterized protein n=1 Tax=Smittium simulii TaxID=133385 RepID=A0A2T9YFN8_9FUNG|nr:hypothetical protein BB561_004556 [Smittium simulii]